MNKIEAAKQEVFVLCRSLHFGGRMWTMSVPHREDDSDRVIMAGLEEAAALLRTAQRLRDTLQEVTTRYIELVESGDCGHWNPHNEQEIEGAEILLASDEVQALGPTEAE